MKYHTLIIGLSMLLLSGCTDNLIHTIPDSPVLLTGNTCRSVFTTATPSTLNEGSQILLNATGGLPVDNQILTYGNNLWQQEDGSEFKWTNGEAETTITAFYPVYPDKAYTQENLYPDGTLDDVLYCRQTFAFGQGINLQFEHLFALCTLRLSDKQQNGFQKITLTCPAVSAIETSSAKIILSEDEEYTTSITTASSDGCYSFIVPAVSDMPVSITIQSNDKTFTTQLPAQSFESNREYIYNVRNHGVGIATTSDWIAFSKLINSKTLTQYNGKTLDDFGETINGVRTYYLLNDLDFSGVKTDNLMQIKENSSFGDVFDGQGYCISNLAPKTKWMTTGIFAKIGTSGIVKNFHAKSCNIGITSKSNSTSEGIGILAGVNQGVIINCSVEDSRIISTKITESNQSANTGGIVGTSSGKIINCYVKRVNIDYNSSDIVAKPAGGICGASQGVILNCYSSNDTIKNRGSYNGGICGNASNNAHIENCYVYSINQVATKGLLAGMATNSYFVHNLYYEATVSIIGKESKDDPNHKTGNIQYTSGFTNKTGIPVHVLLNQWIDQTAPTLYPDYTFTRWKEDKEGKIPAVFVTE